MPDITITGLPNASALTGAERIPMDQSGTTVDAAASAIAALATKATVGLSNVDNTSDTNKPISAATQTALDAKAAAGAIGSSGLTMTAGVLGRESGTGAPVVLSLSGLSIVNGVLTVTASGSGTVTSVAMSVPTGFAVAGSPITTTGTLAVTFAAGYSLPLISSQASWDVAAALAATAVQPAGLTSYVQTIDARLSDSREWSATTITQAEAEAGTATTRRAFTALRVFQAVAAYIAANFSATGQALATAASTAAARTTLGLGTSSTHDVAAAGDASASQVVKGNDSRLSDARTPSAHNQAASTITGLATVATSGAYGDLSGRPTIPAAADATPAALGTAAIGASTDYAREDHVHALPSAADVGALPTAYAIANIAYGATIEIDFAAYTGSLLVVGTLTGNLTFTFSNVVQGRMVTVDILCDATQRNLTFPANARFYGAKPANIAASKGAAISFTVVRSPSSSTDDSAVRVAYGVQS